MPCWIMFRSITSVKPDGSMTKLARTSTASNVSTPWGSVVKDDQLLCFIFPRENYLHVALLRIAVVGLFIQNFYRCFVAVHDGEFILHSLQHVSGHGSKIILVNAENQNPVAHGFSGKRETQSFPSPTVFWKHHLIFVVIKLEYSGVTCWASLYCGMLSKSKNHA